MGGNTFDNYSDLKEKIKYECRASNPYMYLVTIKLFFSEEGNKDLLYIYMCVCVCLCVLGLPTEHVGINPLRCIRVAHCKCNVVKKLYSRFKTCFQSQHLTPKVLGPRHIQIQMLLARHFLQKIAIFLEKNVSGYNLGPTGLEYIRPVSIRHHAVYILPLVWLLPLKKRVK